MDPDFSMPDFLFSSLPTNSNGFTPASNQNSNVFVTQKTIPSANISYPAQNEYVQQSFAPSKPLPNMTFTPLSLHSQPPAPLPPASSAAPPPPPPPPPSFLMENPDSRDSNNNNINNNNNNNNNNHHPYNNNNNNNNSDNHQQMNKNKETQTASISLLPSDAATTIFEMSFSNIQKILQHSTNKDVGLACLDALKAQSSSFQKTIDSAHTNMRLMIQEISMLQSKLNAANEALNVMMRQSLPSSSHPPAPNSAFNSTFHPTGAFLAPSSTAEETKKKRPPGKKHVLQYKSGSL